MKKPKRINKKAEYNKLLEIIQNHKLAIGKRTGYNLLAIARALDIDRKTLKSWLSTSKAQKLITTELEYYLSKMMESGNDDWRQWKAQIDLASKYVEDRGVNDNKKTNIFINDSGKGFSITTEEVE